MNPSFDDETTETRGILDAIWSNLPDALKGPTQFLGRQYAGCGATIGVMPQCDFTCAACYLNKNSPRANPLPIVKIKQQIQELRSWLGPAGNLQFTDGEVTLRPENELIELITYARKIGLVPMLMTHGEVIRKRPGFLERLMTEGGLSEICFHIDTTMSGRGDDYAKVSTEEELNGLRGEFADIIRKARRDTGLRLEAASTMTVTNSNLESVPNIVRWFLANADAFKMVSFLPIAAIGRTDSRLKSVAAEKLWERIAEGADDSNLLRGEGWLGHPSCGRFVQGLAVHRKQGKVLVPLYRRDDRSEMQFLDKLLQRFGGSSFRLDSRWRALRRATYFLIQHPAFIIRHGLPYLWRLFQRTKTFRANYFCIVTHHFMNAAELSAPLGIERRSTCVFKVPVNGKLVSMCALNALGMRDQFYESAGDLELSAKKVI